MEFPRKEGEVETLATTVIAGLTAHVDDFPAPPVPPLELTPALNGLRNAQIALVAAEAAYETAVNTKLTALALLVEGLKKDLRYAESMTDNDPEKLALLGWGGRKPPTPPTTPGQPRDLAIDEQAEGTVDLSWRKPAKGDGGTLRGYLVHRRQKTDGDWTAWTEVGHALAPTMHLAGQPRGIALEFRVVAFNAAGESVPSNTVAVVL